MNRNQFIALVKSEQESLRGFLLALCCGNRDEADDIAQDALVKAYLACNEYSDRGKFRSWLFKIAHNTFLTHLSRLHVHDPIESVRSKLSQDNADAVFEHQDLYLALGSLPPKERSAIVLYYMNGYTIKEIAKITNTTEDAVKKQLSRGRIQLKTKLKI